MGAAISSCSSFTPAFNSDTTGGLVWFQYASGNHLAWRYTTKSNYPVGEALNRPQFVTSQTFDVPYRILATLTTPICGINLMILIGYMSAALTMFGLVKWLFKRTALAYFAGYAAAFVPYHQLKSQSHVVYMFGGFFIGIIWAFLWFVERPSYRRISLLAIVTALSCYFDGYFILLTISLVTVLLALYLIKMIDFSPAKSWFSKWLKTIAKQWRLLLLFAALMVVFIAPIAIVQTTHKAAISQSLSASRGDIRIEAKEYGIRLYEFLLPSFNNAIMPASYGRWLLAHQHFSNASEDTVYLGWTIFVFAIIAAVMLSKASIRRLKLKDNLTYTGMVGMIGAAALVAISLSLQSKFTIAGVTIITPVDVIIHLTAFWRVFARFFLVIDPLAVVLAAAGIYAITHKKSAKFYATIMAVCFITLFAEYLMTPLHAGADVYTDSPQVYHVIAQDKSVSTIAEYPLLNLLYTPSIFTFQPVHGKNVINANDSSFILNAFHSGIAGLRDAQTLGVLQADHVGIITSYGVDAGSVPGLVRYRPADASGSRVGLPPIYSYRIASSMAPRPVLLTAGAGFNQALVDDSNISHHVLSGVGQLDVESVKTEKGGIGGAYDAEFDIQPYFPKSTPHIVIKQLGKTIWESTISAPTHVQLQVQGSSVFSLKTDLGIDLTNLQASPRT